MVMVANYWLLAPKPQLPFLMEPKSLVLQYNPQGFHLKMDSMRCKAF
jgi:hypothetical protein